MRSLRASCLVAFGLCCLLPASATFSQGEKRFGERVDVSVVNVDVFVSDRAGNPVLGLAADDFEVFERGKRVEVTQFYAAGEARATLDASGRPEGVAEQAAPAEPLQLVVLLDNVNTRGGNRGLFLERLKQLLAAELRPGDRVMMASYDRAIRVHLPFSADPADWQAGLARLEASPNYGTDMDGELSVIYEALGYNLEGEGTQGCEHISDAAISRYTYSVTHRVTAATEAISQLLRGLATVPGRKAMLYVSDGLEVRPGVHIARLLEGSCGTSASVRAEGYDIAMALKRMSSVANASRVTLYPFDAAGASSGASRVRSRVKGDLIELEQRSSLRDSLAFLAADTGGRALLNNLDVVSAFRAVQEDAGSFYSLGYATTPGLEHEQRSIEVKVKRKGVEVRFRHGYLARTETEQMRERLLAALWLGEASNPLGARLDAAGEVRPVAAAQLQPVHAVPLRIGVPISALTLTPAGEHREGKLTIFVTAEGRDGSRAQMSVAEVPVRIDESYFTAGKEELYGYELTLQMRAGHQTIAVGVRDDLANVTSVLKHEIEVGAAQVMPEARSEGPGT